MIGEGPMDDSNEHGEANLDHQSNGWSANGGGNTVPGTNGDDRRERVEHAKQDVDGAATSHNGDLAHEATPPEDIIAPRHPETPYTVLPSDVPKLAAEEIGDPIAKNVLTAMLGKVAWMLAEAKAFGKEKGIEPLAQAVADVRKGAYVVQSKREGQPDRELIEGTGHDVAALRVDGQADAKQATRVSDSIPRAAEKLESAVEERAAAQRVRDAAFERRAQVREQEEARRRADEDDAEHAKRTLRKAARKLKQHKLVPALAKAAPPAMLVGGVMVVDAVCTTLNLQPAIANGLNIDPTLAYALAGGVSIGVLMAAAVAGVMLAASRVPARAAAFALVALFLAVMTQFLPGLELMREGEPEGLQSLTTATALAAYVAFGVAYAHGVHRDSEDARKITAEQDDADSRDRKLLERAGSPLQDACDELDLAEDNLAEATAKCEQREAELEGLYAKVESLHDSHERVEARVAGREGEAERAKVRGTVREEILTTQHGQEDASVRHAVNAAWIWWGITRKEKRDPEQPAEQSQTETPVDRVEPSPAERNSVKVAIGSLLAGGVLGLLLGPIAFVVGSAVAAVALIVPLLLGRRSSGGDAAPRTVTDTAPADHIGGLINVNDPKWSEMPSRMVPRYRAADADPGESH